MDQIQRFWKKVNKARLGLVVVLLLVVGAVAWYAWGQHTGPYPLRLRCGAAWAFRRGALEEYGALEEIDMRYTAGVNTDPAKASHLLIPHIQVECRFESLTQTDMDALTADLDALLADEDFLVPLAEGFARRYGGKTDIVEVKETLAREDITGTVFFYLGDELLPEDSANIGGAR